MPFKKGTKHGKAAWAQAAVPVPAPTVPVPAQPPAADITPGRTHLKRITTEVNRLRSSVIVKNTQLEQQIALVAQLKGELEEQKAQVHLARRSLGYQKRRRKLSDPELGPKATKRRARSRTALQPKETEATNETGREGLRGWSPMFRITSMADSNL